jgi:poly[(R)-3-hydroxyalkanoate] polymerase subunit PhaC
MTQGSTSTSTNGTSSADELMREWQEEIARNFGRMRNFSELVRDPDPHDVGSTPREEVYRKRKARLYRYASKSTHATPLLFVPNLGISRPYIFDLLPGSSFVEHLTGQGFDFYLLDWGVFGPEDNDLTLERCVTRVLPRMVRKTLESSGADQVSLLGYCMGAPLSSSYLGITPDAPVKNLIDMAGPIDFSKIGLFGKWLDKRWFDADRFVDTLGQIPSDAVRMGFKLLKPPMDLQTGINLYWNLWNDNYVRGYKALNQWANEYKPFPGEFFRQWVKDFYQDNKLYKSELVLDGKTARLSTINCPVLVIGAREDNIAPPASVRALIDAVGSTDKEYLELPGGHISLVAGRAAYKQCWPTVSSWLAARS